MYKLKNSEYRKFLIILKILPVILGFSSFLEIIFGYLRLNCMILNLLSSTSILLLIFLYSASYVFRFCSYHRMFLHYNCFIIVYKILSLYFNLSVRDYKIFVLLMTTSFMFMIVILYKYLKERSYEYNT